MTNLDQIVELDAVFNDRVLQRTAVNAGVGATDMVADAHGPSCSIFPRSGRWAKPKPSAPITTPGCSRQCAPMWQSSHRNPDLSTPVLQLRAPRSNHAQRANTLPLGLFSARDQLQLRHVCQQQVTPANAAITGEPGEIEAGCSVTMQAPRAWAGFLRCGCHNDATRLRGLQLLLVLDVGEKTQIARPGRSKAPSR